MNRYHRRVQEGILLHGLEAGFAKVHADNKPIPINHPYLGKVHLYRPDATFISTHGKLHIFEVLDSQVHDDNLTIADIIQAYIAPNVARIVFIVPSERDQDRIQDLALIIYGRLVEMGISEKDLRQIRFLYVTPSEARTPRRVARVLAEAFGTESSDARGRPSGRASKRPARSGGARPED